MSRKPRKIEWIKYTGKPPYMCNGYLIVKIDGKKVTFGGRCTESSGTDYPQFWDCGKFENPNLDWDFWRFDEEPIEKELREFSDEEKHILKKLWEEKAPRKECWGCVDD
ncbi:hypothetical protein J6U78_03655 [bacterium]|nr:hypothetical protein [bacterium]